MLGRAQEISRDELKFTKFVQRLRRRFADLFLQALKTQLILKGIITKEDWDNMKESIIVDFMKDNYFAELKEGEVLRERMNTLQLVDPYVGKYYSEKWVRKNILFQTEEEIEEIDAEIDDEHPADERIPALEDPQQDGGDQQQDQEAPTDQPTDQEASWPNN
jgi:hypothetical protein